MTRGCCAPQPPANRGAVPRRAGTGARAAVGGAHDDGRPMRELPAATFLMGTEVGDGFPADGEGPVREVSLRGYAIDLCAVSVADFADFVGDTGYVTEAEHFGWSFVFKNHVPKTAFKKNLVRTVPGLDWWYAVDRACWKRPEGAGSHVRKREDHPVTHVSHARRRGLLHLGRQSGCRPRRSGSMPPAAGTSSVATPGATTSPPAANTTATSGRGSSLTTTAPTTVTPAPARCAPFPPTAMGCTT